MSTSGPASELPSRAWWNATSQTSRSSTSGADQDRQDTARSGPTGGPIRRHRRLAHDHRLARGERARSSVRVPSFRRHNDLYNPTGVAISEFDELPAGPDPFDLICLFSVFTHLAPDDFVAMLRLTRRHVKTDGRLVFSLFLNDPDHPSPVALAVAAKLESDDPAVVAAVAEALAAKDRALELVEGTGWEIVSLNPPEPYIQHYLICRPV